MGLDSFLRSFSFHDDMEYYPKGLYVECAGGYYLLAQPVGCDAHVFDAPRDLTRFALAEIYGTWGILAHLHRVGIILDAFEKGSSVVLIMNTGETIPLVRESRMIFMAEKPYSVYTDFLDLDGKKWKNAALFNHIYSSGRFCVFQTCYEENGVKTAGRQFHVFNRKECENALPTDRNCRKG